MTNYLATTLFGLIQGATEFLPISSSGHLVLLHRLIKLPIADDLTFDVVLHLGTLLAVVFYFRRELFDLVISFLKSFAGGWNEKSRLAWWLMIGTVPASLIAVLAGDYIEVHYRSPISVAFMLIVVGILFFVTERTGQHLKEINNLYWWSALLIGAAQAIALFPGASRSGITIVAGMWLGLARKDAVKFSFLLSIPIITGATIFQGRHLLDSGFPEEEIFLLVAAFIAAFISGFLAIKYFIRFVSRFKLDIFAYYRFGLALLILFLYFWL